MNSLRRLPLERWPDEPQVLERGPDVRPRAERVARGLGWFSLVLGTAELLAPRRLARMLGIRGAEPVLRACGARELASGIATLGVAPRAGLWSRVAGDLLDLALLAAVARRPLRRPFRRPRTRRNIGIAMASVAAVLVVDALAATSLQRQARRREPRDYSSRSGFPRPAADMRGAARSADAVTARQQPALRDTVEDQTRPLH